MNKIKKNVDCLIIGNVTKDINIDYDGTVINEIGGAVYYSSAALFNMGYNVLALTKAKSITDIKDMILPQKDIIFIKAKQTCTMENKYFDKNREIRESKALSNGDSYTIDDIPTDILPKIYHLAGLLHGDYNFDLISFLSKKAPIALDAQAIVRNVSNDKKMFYKDYSDKVKVFPHIKFLKIGKGESDILAGIDNKKDAAKKIFDYGVKEIMTTDNDEIQIFDGKNFYNEKIVSRDFVGRTGRGDTCFSTYICERLTNDIEKSLLIATATVSLKMENIGGFSKERADVLEYIKKQY
jgi:hypothetical protein